MEHWQDQGIVLSVRTHGEGGAVASLLTENHGRHAGFVHGGHASARLRAALQPGAMARVEWQARDTGNLGQYTLEDARGLDPAWLEDSARLAALQSICAILDRAVPEREAHPALFAGTAAMLDMLGDPQDIWGAGMILWELSVLRELGHGLDLSRCAVTGTSEDLAYVSPKTGRAVSEAAAGPYRDRLLKLPVFLRGQGGELTNDEILTGLKLTGYFLEHRLFEHTTHALPEPRLRLPGYFTVA